MNEINDKMIGCLCWFGFRHTIGHDKIGFLKIITEIKENKKRYYSNEFGETFDRCRPVKPDEVKFYDHIGDDNEKVAKLKNDVKTLKEVLLKHCPEFEEWVNKNFGDK